MDRNTLKLPVNIRSSPTLKISLGKSTALQNVLLDKITTPLQIDYASHIITAKRESKKSADTTRADTNMNDYYKLQNVRASKIDAVQRLARYISSESRGFLVSTAQPTIDLLGSCSERKRFTPYRSLTSVSVTATRLIVTIMIMCCTVVYSTDISMSSLEAPIRFNLTSAKTRDAFGSVYDDAQRPSPQLMQLSSQPSRLLSAIPPPVLTNETQHSHKHNNSETSQESNENIMVRSLKAPGVPNESAPPLPTFRHFHLASVDVTFTPWLTASDQLFTGLTATSLESVTITSAIISGGFLGSGNQQSTASVICPYSGVPFTTTSRSYIVAYNVVNTAMSQILFTVVGSNVNVKILGSRVKAGSISDCATLSTAYDTPTNTVSIAACQTCSGWGVHTIVVASTSTSPPLAQPTSQPSGQPSRQPSRQPYVPPSAQPTQQPSCQPSAQPSSQPSGQPSRQPSRQPSAQPSAQPTQQPSRQPSAQPSSQPSGEPSRQPSRQPSAQPSTQPTQQPSHKPSAQPSSQPSGRPSRQPGQPSAQPTSQPSGQPTQQPSCQPSAQPTSQSSGQPSNQPSRQPSAQPSSQPSGQPTQQSFARPSGQPTKGPTAQPTSPPSGQPTQQPAAQPSGQPIKVPSGQPSSQPSAQPTSQLSTPPTDQPSSTPSSQPSCIPTTSPSIRPSAQPSTQPSTQPSSQPQSCPSQQPYSQPTSRPIDRPTGQPSVQPSAQPLGSPSGQPSSRPSSLPSGQPSDVPTSNPTSQPSSHPSSNPTSQPTMLLTTAPAPAPAPAPGEWMRVINGQKVVTHVHVAFVGDAVWACGTSNSDEGGSFCSSIDTETGAINANFPFTWAEIASTFQSNELSRVMVTGYTYTGNAINSHLATCAIDSSKLVCSVKLFEDTHYTAASYIPYVDRTIHIGTTKATNPTVTIVERNPDTVRSFIYLSTIMPSIVLLHVRSPPNFIGGFIGGTCVSAAGVNYIFAGMVRSDTGVMTGLYIAPASASIMNSAGLVNAMVLEYENPDSFIAGGLQLSDSAGMHAYLMRVSSLHRKFIYGVRYRMRSAVIGNFQGLYAQSIALMSTVTAMVLVDTFLYLVINARGDSFSGLNCTGGISVLKANMATGSIAQQVHIHSPNASIQCSDVTVATTFLVLACAVQYATNLTHSVVVAVDRELTFSQIPAGFVRLEEDIFFAESVMFRATYLPLVMRPDEKVSADSTFSTGDAYPTYRPSKIPSGPPSSQPSSAPSGRPSSSPTAAPSVSPQPTSQPSSSGPTNTYKPTLEPTLQPTVEPIFNPTVGPSCTPSVSPTVWPSFSPTARPSPMPSASPSSTKPTSSPSFKPSSKPSPKPSRTSTVLKPVVVPSVSPTATDTIAMKKNVYMERESIILGQVVAGLFGFLCIYQLRKWWVYKVKEVKKDKKRVRKLVAQDLPGQTRYPIFSATVGLWCIKADDDSEDDTDEADAFTTTVESEAAVNTTNHAFTGQGAYINGPIPYIDLEANLPTVMNMEGTHVLPHNAVNTPTVEETGAASSAEDKSYLSNQSSVEEEEEVDDVDVVLSEESYLSEESNSSEDSSSYQSGEEEEEDDDVDVVLSEESYM